MRKDFVKNTIYSTVGFGVLVVCNLVFNFFAARLLGATQYGIFTSFFYLLIAFTQPVNSFQLAVAKYVAKEDSDAGTGIREVSSTLFVFSVIVIAFFTAFSPLIKRLYHLDSIWHVVIGGGAVVMWLALAAYRGVYQGRMNFFMYGLNIGVEGILRAAIAIGFIFIGWGVGGAIGGSVVSGIFGVLLLVFAHRKGFGASLFRFRLNPKILSGFVFAFLVLLPFGLIMNLDLTMVQNIVGGDESGYFSACGLFGKNLIVLSMVIANVVYSYAVKKIGDTFRKGILLTIAIFIAAVLFVIPFGEWMVNLLFGAEFLPMVKYLPLYLTATIPIGILQHIMNYSIAKEIRPIMILTWVFLALLSVIYIFALKWFDLKTFLLISLSAITVMDGILLLVRRRHIQANGE